MAALLQALPLHLASSVSVFSPLSLIRRLVLGLGLTWGTQDHLISRSSVISAGPFF